MIIRWVEQEATIYADWLPEDLERVDQMMTSEHYKAAVAAELLRRWPDAMVITQLVGEHWLHPLDSMVAIDQRQDHPDVEIVKQIVRDVYLNGGWEVYR